MAEDLSQVTRISYTDQGQGEPALLFLPGWCGSRKVFDQLAATTAPRLRSLSLDWRGHGQSESPRGDFGSIDLVEDALSVIESSGAAHVVPVALSHAGWVAIELRRRLGSRISHLVFLDWIILEAPPPFLEVLQSLQDPSHWHQTRQQLFDMWLHGLDTPELVQYVREDMGSYGFDMWARAGREISAAYAQAGSPLQALTHLAPAVPVLHLYAQPEDPAYLAAQQAFAANHPWFSVSKLAARSHFPTLEVADQIAAAIEQFVVQEPAA
ncbi:alpha/beta hydrolase [Vulcanococcus limneticus Candia 3F8]|uniref:alpha/beta fold hydrolase n=1 Tax=Vulcanococcus limneticus TaxID=2170428 RepID=UPI000B98927E|nr:alpha/beta hydrolase [Vulcanococcus limneticus]MCP9792745.1 alpha/beta hydrolase [Vulcanococcus limneticus MW73D5]MCP9894757.1 alpha/beta hydrolase [Vulcanococcus limneticus Candia 3F8]MCP9898213.1 alpha/beta hydrolase [Vulcanococcus limneticus Candia 3B3]